RSAGQYRAGERWAEPSVEHAAELMRQVFEDRAGAATRGQAARATIEASYSAPPVAALIRDRLGVIARRHRLAALARELRAGVPELEPFLTAFEDVGPYLPSKQLRYQRLIEEIRAVVPAAVPAGAVVAVVSRGDDALLALDGRVGWHFPRTADGAYAGHHPADGAAALAHLAELRARGARYLLLPSTALWWLEHYPELRDHLERGCERVWGDDRCLIYQLADQRRADA
ncbi:MAG TPA: hypothetical protein VGL23_03215, partial [Chloroflexota bacterium]